LPIFLFVISNHVKFVLTIHFYILKNKQQKIKFSECSKLVSLISNLNKYVNKFSKELSIVS